MVSEPCQRYSKNYDSLQVRQISISLLQTYTINDDQIKKGGHQKEKKKTILVTLGSRERT